VEWVVVTGDGYSRALLHSFAFVARTVTVVVPGDGNVLVSVYDDRGALVERTPTAAGVVTVTVAPGGFTTVQR